MLKNKEYWRLMSPDDGAAGSSTGASDEGSKDTGDSGASGGDSGSEKIFTQDQVNSMIASEKRKNLNSFYKGLGFESEKQAQEFIEKYKKQEENDKTELDKAQEKAKQLEAEKLAEQSKAQDLQYRFDAVAEGCDVKAANDVVVLAKAKISEDKDFATALKEVKEQYPAMFGQHQESSDNGSTGGGGTSPRGKLTNGDLSGMGKRLAEQNKQSNTAKEHDYFK